MIVYVLYVNKKSVSKRKVCIIFIKNKKFKKTKKKQKNKTFFVGFLGGFFGVFWVIFLGGFFIANPGYVQDYRNRVWWCVAQEPGPPPLIPRFRPAHTYQAVTRDQLGFLQMVRRTLKKQCCGSALVSMEIRIHFLTQCGSGSESRDQWDPCGSGSCSVFKVARSLIFT
jgi:hypothetical protein